MLQEAKVGIGIFRPDDGEDSWRASDCVVDSFSDLTELLLVHGRNTAVQVAVLVQFFLYANFCFTIPVIIFNFTGSLTGVLLYPSPFLSMFSWPFVALPSLVIALLSVTASDKTLITTPGIYKVNHADLTFAVWLSWLCSGIFHVGIICFGLYATFGVSTSLHTDRAVVGGWAYFAAILIVNAKGLFFSYIHQFASAGLLSISAVLFYFPLLYVLSHSAWLLPTLQYAELDGLFENLVFLPEAWAGWVFVVCTTLITDLGYRAYKQWYVPDMNDYLEHFEKFRAALPTSAAFGMGIFSANANRWSSMLEKFKKDWKSKFR